MIFSLRLSTVGTQAIVELENVMNDSIVWPFCNMIKYSLQLRVFLLILLDLLNDSYLKRKQSSKLLHLEVGNLYPCPRLVLSTFIIPPNRLGSLISCAKYPQLHWLYSMVLDRKIVILDIPHSSLLLHVHLLL